MQTERLFSFFGSWLFCSRFFGSGWFRGGFCCRLCWDFGGGFFGCFKLNTGFFRDS